MCVFIIVLASAQFKQLSIENIQCKSKACQLCHCFLNVYYNVFNWYHNSPVCWYTPLQANAITCKHQFQEHTGILNHRTKALLWLIGYCMQQLALICVKPLYRHKHCDRFSYSPVSPGLYFSLASVTCGCRCVCVSV